MTVTTAATPPKMRPHNPTNGLVNLVNHTLSLSTARSVMALHGKSSCCTSSTFSNDLSLVPAASQAESRYPSCNELIQQLGRHGQRLGPSLSLRVAAVGSLGHKSSTHARTDALLDRRRSARPVCQGFFTAANEGFPSRGVDLAVGNKHPERLIGGSHHRASAKSAVGTPFEPL